MTYKEILSSLGFKIEQYTNDKDYKDIIDTPFLNSFEQFYLESITSINELETKITLNNQNGIAAIFSNKTGIEKLKENSKKNISHYQTVQNQKNNSIHEDIEIEIENYNHKKDLIRSKILLESNRVQQLIEENSYSITADNSNLDTFRAPSKQNYNHYIEEFNESYSLKYQQYHSHISRNNYSLKNAFTEIQTHLQTENNDVLEHINRLKVLSDEKKTDLNDDIIKDETLLNEKIKELTDKYSKLKNQNQVQTSLEIQDIRNDIANIESKYQNEIKNINKTARQTLKKIDDEHESSSQNLEQEIMDKKYHHEIKVKTNQEKLNLEIQDFKDDYPSLSFKERVVRRRDLKKLEILNKQEAQSSINEITYLENQLKKMQSKNILDRTLVDLRRKYEINSKVLNENIEKHPLLKKLSQTDKEKKSYDKILDNMLSIVINNEKLDTELLKLSKENNYNIFNTRQQIEISKLAQKSYEITLDKKLSSDIEKLILQYNEDKDQLSRQNTSNLSLLSIEKNKHLNNMNVDSIENSKELNELYLEHYKTLKNLALDHIINISKENSKYNDTAINTYRQIKSNESDNVLHEFKNALNSNEALYNYSIANENYKLQQTRKNNLSEIIDADLETFNNIVYKYKNLLIPHLYSIINYVREDSTKASTYIKYIKTIIESFKNLFEVFKSRIHKHIDTYVKYNTGNKYDQLEENTIYSYNQEIKNVEKEIDQYKATVKNYQGGISKFYSAINELNLLIHQEQLQYNNPSLRRSIRKNIATYTSSINDYRSKIQFNDNKIGLIVEDINVSTRRLNKLKREKIHKLNKLKNLERKDSIVSINTLKELDEVINNYKKFIDETMTLDLYRKVTLNELPTRRFFNLVKKFEYKFLHLRSQIILILDNYDKGLDNTLANIKINNARTYKLAKAACERQNEIDTHNYEREDNRLANIFLSNSIEHKENIMQIEKNYENLVKNENESYQRNRNDIIAKYNKKITKYFYLFKSCDDLILNSKTDYDQALKNIDIDQRIRINEMTNLAKANKRNGQRDTVNKINKFKNEITLLPQIKNNNTESLIEEYKLQNESLKEQNEKIKEEINQEKKIHKKEIDTYTKDIRLNLRKEYLQYKKNQHKIRNDYLQEIKSL